jgi:hypothetical protein
MVFTPNISNDAARPGAQNDPALLSGLQARRSAESKPSDLVPDATGPSVPQFSDSQTELADAAASNAPDYSKDIGDANAADTFMTSLRAGILAQPGTAMLAQANFSPQSVLKLLE